MVNYLYTSSFDYTQSDGQDHTAITRQMLEVVDVYNEADKYDIPGLRDYCQEVLIELYEEGRDIKSGFIGKLRPILHHPFSLLVEYYLAP